MNHHEHGANEFPRDVTGLREAGTTETVEVADGDEIELRIAPVAKRLGEATVRMLAYNGSIPGPTLRVRAGLRDRRRRRQRGRPGGDRALARAAARQPLRRHARDAGADPGRRELHLPRRSSPTPASTGTTRTSARTTARSWPVRQHRRRPGRRRLLAAGPSRARADARRRARSRTARSRRSAATETTYVAMGRFGNVLLVAGETELALDARSPARWCGST